MKKKRSKKHNEVERQRRMSRIFTQGLGILRINDDNCEMVDLVKCCKYKSASRSLVNHFTGAPHKWQVLIAVFTDNGR